MAFERYGHQWEDGALDAVRDQPGDSVGYIGQTHTWVINNLQGVPVSLHGEVRVDITVESDVDKINARIAELTARIASVQARIDDLEARRNEILGV